MGWRPDMNFHCFATMRILNGDMEPVATLSASLATVTSKRLEEHISLNMLFFQIPQVLQRDKALNEREREREREREGGRKWRALIRNNTTNSMKDADLSSAQPNA